MFKSPGANPAGFWAGLWHGMVALIVFPVSLFTRNMSIYEMNNNGRWYDFGFMIGISGSVGGSVASSIFTTPY